MCGVRQNAGAVLFGCRPCDFDVCDKCHGKGGAPQAKFIADITLTDGSVVEPGQAYVKTWRVRNSSASVCWPASARIVNIGGAALGAPVEGFAVPAARPGETVDVSVQLTMPVAPGKYTSFWRLVTGPPSHARFGHRFWVSVHVKDTAGARAGAVTDAALELAVAQLVELGFSDVDRVVQVLGQVDGNVALAADRLLAMAGDE
jgi:hypothetical protein